MCIECLKIVLLKIYPLQDICIYRRFLAPSKTFTFSTLFTLTMSQLIEDNIPDIQISKDQNEKPCDNLDLYFPVRRIFQGSGMRDEVN